MGLLYAHKCHLYIIHFINVSTGDESYDNYQKYATDIFEQLNDLQQNGIDVQGVAHQILLLHSSDWKAAACIDGKYMLNIMTRFKYYNL